MVLQLYMSLRKYHIKHSESVHSLCAVYGGSKCYKCTNPQMNATQGSPCSLLACSFLAPWPPSPEPVLMPGYAKRKNLSSTMLSACTQCEPGSLGARSTNPPWDEILGHGVRLFPRSHVGNLGNRGACGWQWARSPAVLGPSGFNQLEQS